jgi:hypothetical protein
VKHASHVLERFGFPLDERRVIADLPISLPEMVRVNQKFKVPLLKTSLMAS